jgi:hypothetical protein
VHAILHLQADGLDARSDEALEQRLHESSSRSFLAHDYRTKLTVVPNKHNLFRPQNNRDETLWLGSLRALVDQHFLEAAGGQAWVPRAHARAADDVGCHEDLALRNALQAAEFLVVGS